MFRSDRLRAESPIIEVDQSNRYLGRAGFRNPGIHGEESHLDRDAAGRLV